MWSLPIPWSTRDWKRQGLKSIIEVRRISHRNGKHTELSEEVPYYLSSMASVRKDACLSLAFCLKVRLNGMIAISGA